MTRRRAVTRLIGAEGARRPDRHRRLRDRLLVARLSSPVPGRHPQDRSVLRRVDDHARQGGALIRTLVQLGKNSASRPWPRASNTPASSPGCGTRSVRRGRDSSSRRAPPGPGRPALPRGEQRAHLPRSCDLRRLSGSRRTAPDDRRVHPGPVARDVTPQSTGGGTPSALAARPWSHSHTVQA